MHNSNGNEVDSKHNVVSVMVSLIRKEEFSFIRESIDHPIPIYEVLSNIWYV